MFRLNKINAIAARNIDEARYYENDGIFDISEVYTPVLNDNHIYSTYPITQYGKSSIVTGNLIVEPNTNYRLVSGGSITISPEAVFKPGSNVTILENQTLSSTLKYSLLKEQMLSREEIEEIMKEVNAELYDFKPIIDLKDTDLYVYPTPTAEQLFFTYKNNSADNILIEIYNISGQLIIQSEYFDQSIGQNHLDKAPS